MRKFLKKYLDPIVPLYSIVPLVCCFIFNSLIYFGVGLLSEGRFHYDFTLSFDRSVPVIPEFIIIYFGCYIFWIVNSIMIARVSRENCMNYAVAYISSLSICGLFYLFMPTTNVRPDIVGTGISEQLLRWLYSIDKAENLFPSIHCLLSWFCYIGIRGRKEIPKWYRAFSCVFAIMVFLSTQFTKQHYIVDIFGGVAIAEATYYFSSHKEWHIGVTKLFEKISELIFGRENVSENENVYIEE